MNLLSYRSDKYTTTGNDGIIEKIFTTLGVKNGFFVEFGAWDGIKGSNCRKLWEEGWAGIFIEGHKEKYKDLVENYKESDKVTCVNSMVDTDSNLFDDIVEPHVKDKIDFCSIDIDGLDLDVFETFDKYLPTVVCIEGGQMLEVKHKKVDKNIAQNNIQQSLQVYVDSFEKKGYKLLCTYQDSFFVKEELYDLFKLEEQDLFEHYLSGLEALHRRMPWIQAVLSSVGLRNRVIDYILSKSDYYRYGYNNRKLWAVEQKEITIRNIKDLRSQYAGGRKQ